MDAYIDVVGAELKEIMFQKHVQQRPAAQQNGSSGNRKGNQLSSVGVLDVDVKPVMEAPGLQPVLPPLPRMNYVPICCFLCGIALGCAWISMSASILAFTNWFGKDVYNEIQFFYNAPVLFVVVLIKKTDLLAARVLGCWKQLCLCVVLGLAGNSAMMLMWPVYDFEKPWTDTLKHRLYYISAIIGFVSAVGYASFLNLVKRMSDVANTAFRLGFMSSGVTVLVFQLLTGWTTPWWDKDYSEKWFWNVAGIVVASGLVAAACLMLTGEVRKALEEKKFEAHLDHCNNVLRESDGKRVISGRQSAPLGAVLWQTLPSALAIAVSFAAGMFVFVHLPFLPKCDPFMPVYWVYINMFADYAGQALGNAAQKGYVPIIRITKQWHSVAFALVRGGIAVLMVFYIDDPTFVDDRWLSLILTGFVILSGATVESMYRAACDSVRFEDRDTVVGFLSMAVFFGLYMAFLGAFLLNRWFWEGRSIASTVGHCT